MPVNQIKHTKSKLLGGISKGNVGALVRHAFNHMKDTMAGTDDFGSCSLRSSRLRSDLKCFIFPRKRQIWHWSSDKIA